MFNFQFFIIILTGKIKRSFASCFHSLKEIIYSIIHSLFNNHTAHITFLFIQSFRDTSGVKPDIYPRIYPKFKHTVRHPGCFTTVGWFNVRRAKKILLENPRTVSNYGNPSLSVNFLVFLCSSRNICFDLSSCSLYFR